MEPYRPINVLKPVVDDVWLVDGPLIGFRYMGVRLPFPTRMTIIRLSDGGLWVHSPTKPAPDIRSHTFRDRTDGAAAVGPRETWPGPSPDRA